VAKTGLVTEIRPGTYIFKDLLLLSEHVAEMEDIAVRFAATVVSTPDPSYAILDGGTKMFPTDTPVGLAPVFANGYAVVENRPDLALARMNEEHGILTSETGDTGLKVGDVLTLIPVHVCTAINMQNSVYLLEDGKLRKQVVDARGMLV
jgi:D-serine deaminase-like pyridoxal phosphate-dependent protein